MVRETRHLWVGNLPENIREDRIRDHFKRYGRVQSVKLLPRAKDDEGSGVSATVSFMDIKSASKAHNNEQKLEERVLSTEYHEPAAIPGSGPPLYSQRFNHGPPEEINSFERSSHFYERDRDRRDGDAYLRRASSTYHVAAEPLRGRTRDRHYRNGPYTPIIESVVSRQPPHHRGVGSSWTYDTPSRYSQPSTPDVYNDDRREITPVVVVHKKHTKSRSGSSGSNSGSSMSRSRSSSSSSQSGSSSCSSASSSPASDKSCSTHSHHGSLRSGVTLQSAVSTPHTNNSSPAVHSEDRRPLAICVRNLPARSSDTSLKDGLFHEYKKHGKVTWVKVVGQGSDRYALVCFKKPDDVEKALQVSHDKLFFGCKIEVAPYQGYDVDDNEFRFVARPYEAEQDEFHPKATRTLFIGNLEKDITAPELRKHFDQFGEIIEIDIKKQGSNSSYAFCQYCDIGSVVRAMRTLDGEHLGNNRIKLGFGKSLHTNCVWVDGVAESVTEKYLSLQFSQFGPVSHVAIDRTRGHALVFYDQIAFAQSAVKEMRGVVVRGRKLQVDFASRECQEAFYDHLEKQTGHNTSFDSSVQVSPQGVANNLVRGFETPSSSSSSSGGGTSRYPRYSTQPSVARSFTRNSNNSSASPNVSPSTPARNTPRHVTTTPRFDFNTDYIPERRPYRSYEEMSLEDGGGIVTVTVGQGPQDIRHLQKERVALLEQLEDCTSSGEEGSSRRRCKHRRSHSGEGSRPGTPLCDERPENLPPVEPRRTPRERPPDPLSLPLPRFATQLMSPRPAPPSPPASPPRPHSASSDDSEPSPPSPEWEERLRSLDEKYEKWSGSRTVMAKVDPATLRVRHKLLDLELNELQPSDIVKSVLAKRSVFDEDSKRLENFGEKYEPREFVPTRPGLTTLRPRLDSPVIHSPAAPKSPASASSPAGAKGLQYPFPSHPPVLPTTSVATTTAAISTVSCSSISSGILIASINTTAESSKSPQTFPTSCISSVLSVRQFHSPSSTFQPIPKVSPPSGSDKKSENVDPRCVDRTKNPSKLSPPCSLISDRVDVSKKESTTPIKPLKSCLRRESGDEKVEIDERRKSREEDNKAVVSLKCDFEKGREVDVSERRRSLSDPRRRDSIDSNIDSLCCESVSDKLKDRNHKEDRRRRESVDNIAKKDTEISDIVKSRLSDSRSNDQSDFSDCSKIADVQYTNLRLDDNTRRSQVTDTLEKKKDTLQICPERDRRRGKDSIDNSCSDNLKNRKVPESLDIKKELESDTRQGDNSADKNDPSIIKSLECNERRKDSGQTENPSIAETFERRKEKDQSNPSQENFRDRERKDPLSLKKEKESIDCLENSRHKHLLRSPESINIQRHKDDRLKHYSHSENARHRDNCVRKESDSSDDNPLKINESKKETENHPTNKQIDTSLLKKDQMSCDSLNSSSKVENTQVQEQFHSKEVKRNCELIDSLRHRENSKHDHTRLRESDKRKENINETYNNCSNDYKKEDYYSSVKVKHLEHGNSDISKHSKNSSFDYTLIKTKDYDRRKDCEKQHPKIQDVPSQDNPKHKNCVKQNDKESVNQISKWVEEIRKDLESSCHAKIRDSLNEVESVDKKNKISESYFHNEIFKKEDKVRDDYKKDDGFVENERKRLCNSSENMYFDRKKMSDTAEIFRRKEVSFKKVVNDNEETRLKEFEKKKEIIAENCKYSRNISIKKKEDFERDISDLNNRNNSVMTNDFLEERQLPNKPDFEQNRKIKRENSDKECIESDSNDHKDLELRIHELERQDEDIIRKNDFFRKQKKKERINSWPAAIGGKRRLSSQDFLDICSDESKKSKPERRDSKDSNRSSCSSKKSNCERQNKSFTKLLEDKIKEDKDREICKKKKDDDISLENAKILCKKDKQTLGERRKEDRKGKVRLKENGITASESEAGSGDDDKTPKKHSIFDIVDEEPAYISMYDKVKARSTKNMQKQEEEKRQERLKEKFNQLKQSRAKREEKKRSTSYDEDSDSERGGRRSNKLMTSSEEDIGSENDMRNQSRKIMSDTSEDDIHRLSNSLRIKQIRIHTEDLEPKSRKILSDTSEDDSLRLSVSRIKAARVHQEDAEPKLRKILSDTSEDDLLKHSLTRMKPSRLQSDESEVDLGFEHPKKDDGFGKQSNSYISSDLFSNISDDPEHPTMADLEKEQFDKYHRNSIDDSNSDLPRKRSHKKKQKRQKSLDEVDEGNMKRHSSKKDRRKSSHSHDGDDDGQSKIRKKKNDRESSSKRDGKMEDIFGPLSDDSDKVPNKWHTSQMYGSDSEEERQIMRKRDKKRKDRKARELDEAGRALEAKLMDSYEGFQPSSDVLKAKKKKRKKSREEKVNKHYQEKPEEEAAALANEADSERESETVVLAPSLPRLIDSPPTCLNQNKKPDIPGFGSQVDENIHETAVKSISESPTKPIEEKQEVIEETTNNQDDKPTPVISQEETEDAVAALLLEDSFGGGFESYTKPDTPVSEPDLQIDTDTEDTFDPIDFSRPPRTPDIPSSFYRQQDTREGLEERILALACPDNTSNKAEDGNNIVDSSSAQTSNASVIDKKIKADDNNKETLLNPTDTTNVSSKVKKLNDNKCDSKKDKVLQTPVPVESGKRHDLPPLVCHGENSHTVQPLKGNYLEMKSQVASEQSLPKLQVEKVNSDKTSTSISVSQTVTLPNTTSPLMQSSSQILKKSAFDPKSSVTSVSTASNKTEPVGIAQNVHPQPNSNQSAVFSTHVDVNLHQKLHTKPTIQEGSLDKPVACAKPVNHIITPTSVALIVQTQSKLSQPSSQNSSVLQLSTKMNSSGSQQVDLKGGAQYVLHHTVQPSQIIGNTTNRVTNQQSGSPVQGTSGQGNHKLSVPAMPVKAKSPGLLVSTKTPGASSSVKSPVQPSLHEQPFKQMLLNHPLNQQLSVNVSHNHQLNSNLLISPNKKINVSHSPVSHNSPTALSFSSHHMKVSLAQQQTNTIHSSSIQLSPNPHQISNQHKQLQHCSNQQSIGQHAVQNQYQNKSSSHLLQPVPNCISSMPVKLCSPTKPGIVNTTSSLPTQNFTPVPQSSQVNKISAHVLQTSGVQPVRAVVLQNPKKQTVTLIQPQMVHKPLGVQMIRPLNAPQPQVVHTLKNEPPSAEKTKHEPENIPISLSQNNEIQSQPPKVIVSKPCEEPISLASIKKEDSQVVPEDVQIFPPKVEHNVEIKNKIVKPVLEESKQLHAVIQDLTHKAVMANQSFSSNSQLEEVICSAKPIVDDTELNDKIKGCESKDIKLEEKPEIQITNSNSVSLTKTAFEFSKPGEKNDKIDEKVEEEDELKLIQCHVDVKTDVEAMKCEIEKPVEQQNDGSNAGSIDIDQSKTINEPKVEKIRIKKEDTGLFVESTPSSTSLQVIKPTVDEKSIKTEVKNDETHSENLKIVKPDGAEDNIKDIVPIKEDVSTSSCRGRGGRRRKACGRGGGVVTRRARLNNSTSATSDMTSADVYEFRDDSEEEANRPRLILTIKSPDLVPTAPTQPNNSSSTRKSRRLQEKDGTRNTVDDTIEDVIRGTRSSRRTTRASANNTVTPAMETRKSPRRKQSSVPPLPLLGQVICEVKPAATTDVVASDSLAPTPQSPPPVPPQPQSTPSAEPMTLIDPVTGLLIPMRESEEGQYIPVNTDLTRPGVESKEDSGEPAEKRIRTTLPTESEASLLSRPGIPVKVPPNCAVVPPLPPKPTAPLELSRPIISHSKTAIVTKATGIVVPSSIPRPISTIANPVTLNKPLTISAPSLVKPQGVLMSPTGINSKASVTNIVGPMTINKVVAPPSVSPSGKPLAPIISSNSSHNHKAHLLQAVRGKVPVAKVPTPMTPKAHILHSMGNVAGLVGPGTPPPPHHGALLTGSVASPPLRTPHHLSQPPIVTGASSTRVVCKGLMEPLKVEPGSCIVVPSASPQPRTQVMQAGLPVPAYEASLHGLVAELLPNPQWPHQSPPPAHQPQGEAVQHVNFPPHHIQPAHYVHPQLMYHQYLREAALTGYHLPSGVKSELEESRASPPLELRRGSPHDRATDSPQVATVYVHGSRHLYYEPPPAHRPSQPRLQVATPPHASQVPPQADSLLMLLQRYPVMWQGLLALKTDQAAVQMHFVFGNPHVARDSLPCNSDGSTPPLRIAQRMRLEQTQVEGVARKMQMDHEHCMLLALPCGRDHMDVLQQSNNLQSGFITYLQQKQAAGIVNIAGPGSQQAAYVVHIFPSCDFANESLARIAPDLLHRVANIAHLLIVIATV